MSNIGAGSSRTERLTERGYAGGGRGYAGGG